MRSDVEDREQFQAYPPGVALSQRSEGVATLLGSLRGASIPQIPARTLFEPSYPNGRPGKLLLRHCYPRADQHFYTHASGHIDGKLRLRGLGSLRGPSR